jgi:hypothetical protein
MNIENSIKIRINKHHQLYDLPLTAEYWEETLHKSFSDIGQNTDWQPDRSHKISEDMKHEYFGRISCKSGAVKITKKKKALVVSGSRTGKYKTIEEKLKFFSLKKEDVYFCLSRNKKEWDKGSKKYYLYVFNSSILNLSEQTWNETGGGWRCENKIYKAWITKKLSDQLWFEINMEYLPEPTLIEIQ